MTLILASQSSARNQLLLNAGFTPVVIPSSVDEDLIKNDDHYEEIRQRAKLKGDDVLKNLQPTTYNLQPTIILSADSGALLGDSHFEKPRDYDDAVRILKNLSGKRHILFTAFQLIFVKDGKEVKRINDEDKSFVTFNTLSDEQIKNYLDKFPKYKKYAGGYAVGLDSKDPFIKSIEGSITNVIGLPMEKVIPLIKDLH
jgi:septum formation protein